MATIIMNYEELTHHLKDDCATYVRVPEIDIHVMIMRKKDMVIIKNLDNAPLCVEQEDFVTCVPENVLHKTTVHDNAKVFLDCRKIAGVWTKNEERDFIHILYPKSPPNSPKYPTLKRKHTAQFFEEETYPKLNQEPGRT